MTIPQSRSALARRPWRGNTLVVGSERDFRFVLDRVKAHPELQFRLVSFVRTRGRPASLTIGQVRNIKRIVEGGSIDQIAFTSSYQLDGSFRELEHACRQSGAAMCILS